MSANLEQALQMFSGSVDYFPHWLGRFVYTDGVRYLADNAGAHWPLDAISAHQHDKRIRGNQMLKEIQFWTLRRNPNGGATLAIFEDSGRPPVLTQQVAWTDFPLDEVKLYLANSVLMLPSEY